MSDKVEIENDEVEIEIVEDSFSQGEKDAGRPVATEEPSPVPGDDELSRYDESVRNRIRGAHAEAHAQRRAAEVEAVGRRTAETLAIQALQREATLMAATAEIARNALSQQAKTLREQAVAATLNGDAEKAIEAQSELAKVHSQLAQLPSTETVQRDAQANLERAKQQLATPAAAAPAVSTQVQAALVRNTEAWKARNPWFGNDPQRTADAQQAHQAVTARDPSLLPGSDEYFRRVEGVLSSVYGEKPPMRPPSVAPSPGNPPASKAKTQRLVLTAAEADTAKRLYGKAGNAVQGRMTEAQFLKSYALARVTN